MYLSDFNLDAKETTIEVWLPIVFLAFKSYSNDIHNHQNIGIFLWES